MSDSPKYFFDENLLPVAKAIDCVRPDIVFPGHKAFPEFSLGMQDQVWLPMVGERNIIAITQDGNIRYNPAEQQAVLNYGVMLVVMTVKNDMTKWEKLSVVVRNWVKLENFVRRNTKGPWIALMTLTEVKHAK